MNRTVNFKLDYYNITRDAHDFYLFLMGKKAPRGNRRDKGALINDKHRDILCRNKDHLNDLSLLYLSRIEIFMLVENS